MPVYQDIREEVLKLKYKPMVHNVLSISSLNYERTKRELLYHERICLSTFDRIRKKAYYIRQMTEQTAVLEVLNGDESRRSVLRFLPGAEAGNIHANEQDRSCPHLRSLH